ncbi:hypothetical protein RFI_10894, partial [Reticulomyxa filosa]
MFLDCPNKRNLGEVRLEIPGKGTSVRYWEITTNDKSYSIRFGQGSGKGRTCVKEFPDEELCKKAALEAIKTKEEEGYKKVEDDDKKGGSATDPKSDDKGESATAPKSDDKGESESATDPKPPALKRQRVEDGSSKDTKEADKEEEEFKDPAKDTKKRARGRPARSKHVSSSDDDDDDNNNTLTEEEMKQ